MIEVYDAIDGRKLEKTEYSIIDDILMLSRSGKYRIEYTKNGVRMNREQRRKNGIKKQIVKFDEYFEINKKIRDACDEVFK